MHGLHLKVNPSAIPPAQTLPDCEHVMVCVFRVISDALEDLDPPAQKETMDHR